MTDPNDISLPCERAPTAKWLALAAAAVLLPAAPAVAAAAADTATDNADASAPGEGPRNPLAPQRDLTLPPPSVESMGPPAPPPSSSADVAGTMLYGPPAPKVERGKLAEVSWPEAPEEVPPALENAITIATKNYPSAKSGRAALRAAHADVRAAKWLRFPSLSGTLEYIDSDTNPDPQVSVEAPIWAGGRITSNIRRAKALEDSSSAAYVSTVETLALTTSQTYFEIARLTRREQLYADSVKEHLRLVETMERRVQQEVSPLADLELARSRAAQIEQEYTITRSQRETALRVMAELIADPSYDLGPIPFYDPALEVPNREALEEQAVAYDPALRGLNAEADVARAELDARKASILPQVNARYSYDDVFGSRMGLVVRAQTTGGLSQISEINSARLRIQSALENQRQAEQRLRRDVAADIIEYDAAKARASISTRASDTAARVSESYMRQFIAGRRSWLDVMNALREAISAQVGKADAELTAMSAGVRLMLRSGRWRPEFIQPERPSSQDAGEPTLAGPVQ